MAGREGRKFGVGGGGGGGSKEVVWRTFQALAESAEKKFARVRDVPLYGTGGPHPQQGNYHFGKVFKAYMRLWKYQQENRPALVDAGLNRWEIGDIAGRIAQLYFTQYMRTSQPRFLLESYVFYEAILNRNYFDHTRDLALRFKKLRFYARFSLVALILNRNDTVRLLVDGFRALVHDSLSSFPETNFKEWKLVVQEIVRFIEVDTAFANVRPLRYSVLFDSHPVSRPYVARFHAKKVLKFKDALLMSYHRHEVKFAELTLDTYRMLQCLEWEPGGSFHQKHPVESIYQKHMGESNANGSMIDHSGPSGLIDMNLAADLTDPSLPPNPRKAILYRPSATHLLAVMATICEDLPPESIMLIYLSASGKGGPKNVSHVESSGGSRKYSNNKIASGISSEKQSVVADCHSNGKRESSDYYDSYLVLGPKGNEGSNVLYPGDLIPFTRRPIFLIIDSDNSHAFKADTGNHACYSQDTVKKPGIHVLHGVERGETAALLLSPPKPAFRNVSGVDITRNGSQFTFFLTAPLQALCQMVGISSPDTDTDVYNDAEEILSTAFSEWEVILCTSKNLDLVWAQVLSDPFLRRLILRFIFCRSVLSAFCASEDEEQFLPVCLPQLPGSVSAISEVVQSAVLRLANHLKIADCFSF
ncbi:hypothetical protein Tsubulata_001293 [Turnera subulata]|uniref:Protein SCAI n=1 Tax=Turnera subulata TaxID=218843 RepID=A0A9Q0JA21_9ROSI|nr:hypothetical protein Tsubulata_001293 [Turnera subulata]